MPVPITPSAFKQYTVLDVISSALRLIGVLASGETADAALANDSLSTLHDMWDSWNAQRFNIFTVQRLVFNLTSGKQVYSYGSQAPIPAPAPDFNSPRPASIERVGIINLNNPQQPLELPMQYLTVAQWQEIPVKNILSALPQYVWDDQGYPYRNLSFWPIPNVTLQVAIYPWVSLNEPINLTTLMIFPPGYAKAFRYNLAVDLAAELPVIPVGVLGPVAKIAEDSLNVVKQMNIPIIDLRCDPALVASEQEGLYNWISDMPAGR